MISPEKNDVNISKLFHWGQKFEIIDRYGNKLADTYIRLVGDADLNKARVFAIRKSAELRKSLRTEGTDDRIAFISTVYEMDDVNGLLDMVVSLNTRNSAQEAAKELQLALPKEPKSDAPLESFEKFQKEVDEFPEKRMQLLNELTMEKLQTYRTSIENMKPDDLRKLYEKRMIDELCERRMLTVFREVCAFFGSFSDENFENRMFSSYEEFENLPTEIKEQYLAFYEGLEINVDELKKSLEVTQ